MSKGEGSKITWTEIGLCISAAVLLSAVGLIGLSGDAPVTPQPQAVSRDAGDTTGPRVTALTPVPASNQATPPTEVIATFDEAIREESLNAATFRLIRSGGDGTFADGNEVLIVPAAVTLVDPTHAKLDLQGVRLPDDVYRVILLGTTPPPNVINTSTSTSSTSSSSSSSTTSTSTGTSTSGGSGTTTTTTTTTGG